MVDRSVIYMLVGRSRQQMKILIIIPAYNEAENIVNVVENLKSKYQMFDYVVVNDGSRDKTAEICRNNKYNLVDLPINLGLSGAFQTGMKYAYITIMITPFSMMGTDNIIRSI